MSINQVTDKDCGRIQGEDINPLQAAILNVCPGIAGDALWGRIREKHNLGYVSCNEWVDAMNIAIGIWNASEPKSCEEVRKAFDV